MRCSSVRAGDRAAGAAGAPTRRAAQRVARAGRAALAATALVASIAAISPATSAAAQDDPAAVWTAVPDAFVPGHDGSRIVPTPQETTPGEGAFALTAGTTVVLHADTPAIRLAASMLQQDAARQHGLRPQIRDAASAETAGAAAAIRVGIVGRDGAPAGTATPVERPEGYLLEVGPAGVTVLGADERGAVHGLHSLRQLLGGGPEVAAVTVRDWPTLPWRVAMVYLDASSDAVNERLLPILAELKFNAVLVMSDHVHWDAAPELHQPQGASRAAAERLAATARAHLLEPIPLLETLSHAEWFFANGANAELRADPTAARAFVMDPTRPELYERLLPIVDELLDIFEPRWLHIGHDEVRNVHPFPATPQQREVGYGRLFTGSVARLHAHLAARGVGTMLWDDELVAPEVRALWSELPDDLTVVSWRYLPAGVYPRLELVAGAGFRTLGASWFEPDNVSAMARTVARLGDEGADAVGLVQTRWTGYFGNAGLLRGQYRQVYAYVTAAAAAWNPAADPPSAAPAWFRSAWLADPQGGTRSGALIDLAPLGGRPLELGPFGLDDGYALTSLADHEGRFGGVRYRLGTALTLGGTHPRARDQPERISIPVGRTAGTVAFLHATGWYAPEGETVGRYEVVYADGVRTELPLVYGRDLAAWTETEVETIDLDQPWQGRTRNGLPVATYQLRWRNPRPEVPIDRIELVAGGGIAAPIVFGVTLLD